MDDKRMNTGGRGREPGARDDGRPRGAHGPDDLLSAADAAADLGISGRRVLVLIAAGRLAATRIGARSWAIRYRDLAAVRVRDGRPGPKPRGGTGAISESEITPASRK